MNFAKFKLFFNSRDYRKMCLLYVKLYFIKFIMKPFIFIKAVFETFKFNHDYPNSWDRYVNLKEIEHNTEVKQKNKAKATSYTKLIGAISRFDICILSYSSCSNRSDITKEDYEVQYDAAKKEIQACIEELEKLDVVISDEFKSIVMSTNVDSFTNLDEYIEFHTNLHIVCDKIIVTY